MQRLDGQLVLSPTDLTQHQECRHLTFLDLGVATGRWAAPDGETSEELQFVFDRGLEHEKKYLASLVAAGKTVAEIETAFDAAGRRRAEAQTVEAMRRGVDGPGASQPRATGVREVAAQGRGGAGTERLGAEMRVSQRVLASCRSAWVTTENTSVAV